MQRLRERLAVEFQRTVDSGKRRLNLAVLREKLEKETPNLDERRKKLIAALTAAGLGVRVLLVSESTPADAEGVLVLHPGKIEAGLAKL